jgi:hypothetical protein
MDKTRIKLGQKSKKTKKIKDFLGLCPGQFVLKWTAYTKTEKFKVFLAKPVF